MTELNVSRLILLTILLLPFSVANADSGQSLTAKADAFATRLLQEKHTDSRVEVEVNPLSSRIKLVSCSQPVQFSTSYSGGSRMSLRAICTQPRWQLYMTAKAQITKPVFVSRSTILKGQRIKRSDIEQRNTDIANLRSNYFTDSESIIGKSARYNIVANKVLKGSMLTEALLIEKGDAVTIEARRGSLSIRTSGTAMQNGKKGKQISVRNAKSGTIIKAVIIAPGLVRTP